MLRGGPLAETRVINLLNRRFISFYFNVGRGGQGYDADAAAYIAKVDPRFGGNAVPTPPVWIFSPEGKLLATIDNFASKDVFFSSLLKVLQDHADYNRVTGDEQKLIDAAAAANATDDERLAHAQLLEQLGRESAAAGEYGKVAASAPAGSKATAVAQLGIARLARLTQKWTTLDRALAAVEAANTDNRHGLADEVAMERAYHLQADGKHKELREHLEAAVKAYPASKRLGEMHFTLGVACLLLDDAAWANYHFCWVMENLPADRLYMRCYLAASREAIPYPNPELGGFRSRNGMVSHALADRARDRAMQDYARLKRQLATPAPTPANPTPTPNGNGNGPRVEDF
ncbi:MAG: hypothetical protein AB7K09_06905 [Planctomycetota bacterium]